jgi:hypothetical protein
LSDKLGDLVDHAGRKLADPEKGGSWKEAKKVLDWLKNKKGGFFSSSVPIPFMFEWQEQLIDYPWVNEKNTFDECGNPDPA